MDNLPRVHRVTPLVCSLSTVRVLVHAIVYFTSFTLHIRHVAIYTIGKYYTQVIMYYSGCCVCSFALAKVMLYPAVYVVP